MNKKLQPFAFALIAVLAIWSSMMWDKQRAALKRAQIDPTQLEQVKGALEKLSPQDVLERVTQGKGKPLVFFVYASWCSYCKKYMPDLLKVLEEKEFARVERVFVSVDTETQKLVEFLAASGYAGKFTPYVVRQTPDDTLKMALDGLASGYRGSIPYLAWFDARGRLAAEGTGGLDPQTLRRLVQK